MHYPIQRFHRLRHSSLLRTLVSEVRVDIKDLIAPIFLVPGTDHKKEIASLPGQYNVSIDQGIAFAKRLYDLGIRSFLLFGIPEYKDELGSSAWKEDGIVQKAIKALKDALPEILVITDLCFCEYTSHGHCGVMKEGKLDNDATLELIKKQALSHARAGADIIAPSGMMDGCIKTMREALDEASFTMLPLMAYSAKYASAFYGPFREAVQSTPSFGDRKSYQMDPANRKEALREVASDIKEGADIVMIKPALPFLDVISDVKNEFGYPTAAYNVSGEYAMVKAAALNGWIDGTQAMYEMLLSIKRAGADMIITYFAEEFAKLRLEGRL